MKVTNLDERVHVLDANTDVSSVIKTIAESGVQEEAFYVCDIGEIVKKHKLFKMALPRVDPHYAVKCNDSLTVLEVIASLGAGFDCASKSEINKVLSLGVDPSRVIFANPAKPASHIKHANAMGIARMTFDNESELHKVKKFYPDAKMVIRIRCDAEVSQCPLGIKFGCDPVTEAPRLLRIARSLNLDVIGVSFHVGSGCGDPPVFRRAIAAARSIFNYAAQLGYQMNLLDLGGGYPGVKGTSIDKIAEIINLALDDFFPDPSVDIIAEPGRFYVASAYTLACNIHSIRRIQNHEGDVAHIMYYINDGVYGSFNCILYDHQVVNPTLLKEFRGKMYPSSIWGPTCDGLDRVIESVLLPELQVGDWMVFEDMGAYTLPVASPFNGFPIPKVHMCADESIWLLLKDMLPLTEEHFVIGNTPTNLRLGLDIGGTDIEAWSNLPPIEINLPMQMPMSLPSMCHDTNMEEPVYEYVDIGPLN